MCFVLIKLYCNLKHHLVRPIRSLENYITKLNEEQKIV